MILPSQPAFVPGLDGFGISIMPLQDRRPTGKSNLGLEKLKLLMRERLGEGISKLTSQGDIRNTKQAVLNMFSNEVIIESHMLHTIMKNEVCIEVGGTNIITINNRLMWNGDTQVGK